MRICAAQTRPYRGDIQKNIDAHEKLILLAASVNADTIIFPELSITCYEPELANNLAVTHNDDRFNALQQLSDTRKITIGIGAPVKQNVGTSISMIIFQPDQPRQTYSKKYLHNSEEQYFVSCQNDSVVIRSKPEMALAICYELSVPGHAEKASKTGASFYLAGVVEDVNGVDRAIKKLSDIGKKYSMTVAMSNCVGKTGEYYCPGKSSIWNNQGKLVGQLNEMNEGVLIFDTETQEVLVKML